MTISAALVKELRERTGSGMMECKKALTETQGDLEAAIEWMRKSGLAKADKKSGRTAAEGQIVIKIADDQRAAVMVDINCETDFVAKGDDFTAFADQVAGCLLQNDIADAAQLSEARLGEATVDETRRALVAKLGENISIRRCEKFVTADGAVYGYLHGSRIGVLVELAAADAELGKDIAMHIAASRPLCVDAKDVAPELIAKEREIYAAQAAESGKPANIIEKMVDGRVSKFLSEVTLLGQAFVKNPDQTVGQLLKEKQNQVSRFSRFEVGEGIEKKVENFAEEVMAQVKGS